MAQVKVPEYADSESVEADFRFKTFSEMAAVFGRSRAASLLQKARSQRQAGKGPQITLEDIEVTRVFLGFTEPEPGKKQGQLSGKALKVFKAYATHEATAKAAVKRFLDKTEQSLREKHRSLTNSY